MVNENSTQITFRKIEERLTRIEQQLNQLQKTVSSHLGSQLGANTSNVPHPQISAIPRGSYAVTNGNLDRTFDADSTSTAELADIIYTIIQDLKAIHILG